jgi:hypothetical protein
MTQTSFDVGWDPAKGATNYLLDLSVDKFSTYLYHDKLLGSDTYTTVDSLQPGTWYYYRIRAANASGTSMYSPIDSIITVPATPVPLDPIISIDSTSFTARWHSCRGTTQYLVEVFPIRGFFAWDYVTDTVVVVEVPDHQHNYTFAVAAMNTSGISPTSPPMYVNFLVTGVTESGKQIYIYPNPAEAEIRISGDDLTTQEKTLRITDAVGRTVITQQVFGSDTPVNITNLPAGLYFVDVEDGKAHRNVKLVKK